MSDQQQSSLSATSRQRKLYTDGTRGKMPIIPTNYNNLEKLAKERMTPEAFAYVSGGAGLEETIAQNRSSFNQWNILPRMLCDVSQSDTSVKLLGHKLPAPFLLAPIGASELMHQEADLAIAAAARDTGIPMIFSNQASISMEICSRIMENSPRWFQLYWSKSDELVTSFVKRAENSECTAIVVTLDTTMLGWRTRDLDLGHLPFLHGKGIAQYTSDPVFTRMLEADKEENSPKQKLTPTAIASAFQLANRFPGGLLDNLRSRKAIKAVQKFVELYSRPSLTWDNLAFLREQTKLPILLKGILHPDDAQKALDHGINGIIVSNHGGRQVDGAISSIQALPGVVKTVNEQIPVLMDSGIRGGADAFKAIALGAKAVCIGRPYAYALSIAGRTGVEELIRNYIADFELTMRLAGCKSVSEIKRTYLRKTGG